VSRESASDLPITNAWLEVHRQLTVTTLSISDRDALLDSSRVCSALLMHTHNKTADHCEALQLVASDDDAQRRRLVQEHPSVSLIPPIGAISTHDRHGN
jgi:hypothetical protein